MHGRVLPVAGVRALAAPVSALFSVFVVAAACDRPDTDRSRTGTEASAEAAPTWTLSSEPRLEIGVLTGDEPYQLHGVTSVARLPDGGVVVANGGSDELRFFDARGRFVARQGRSGEGPAEWRNVSRVRLVDGPEIRVPEVRVYDNSLRRVGTVALDAPAHLVRVTEAGRLWVSSWRSSDVPVEWTVHDLKGEVIATLETPAGFEVHDVGQDWLLGVGRDSLDVQYVRLYELDRDGSPYDASALARAVASAAEGQSGNPLFRPLKGDSIAHVNGALKAMASHQEAHYSEHLRYASSTDSFGSARSPFELPENVEAQILRAGSDGWAARFVDVDDGRGCMLVYGRFTLVGISNGSVRCWGPTRTATADG